MHVLQARREESFDAHLVGFVLGIIYSATQRDLETEAVLHLRAAVGWEIVRARLAPCLPVCCRHFPSVWHIETFSLATQVALKEASRSGFAG